MDDVERNFLASKKQEFVDDVFKELPPIERSLANEVKALTEGGQYDLAVFMKDNPFAREAVKTDSDHPSQTMAILAVALEICTHRGA